MFCMHAAHLMTWPQVNAVREIGEELRGMQLLYPHDLNGVTCARRCNYDEDCNDGWVCNKCRWDVITSKYICGPFNSLPSAPIY